MIESGSTRNLTLLGVSAIASALIGALLIQGYRGSAVPLPQP